MLALFTLLSVLAAAPQPLRARFIGNMAFEISDGTTTLLTDFPYESGAFGYMAWKEPSPPPEPKALCLITHSHADHWLPRLAPRYCARIAGPPDVAAAAGASALDVGAGASWGAVRITPVPSVHGQTQHFSYVVDWNGRRLFFSGDTEDLTPLLAQRDLDVAFVSPWLLARARARAAVIPARRVIVYHHRDDEAVVDYQGRQVPRQGDEILLSE